MSTSTCSSDPLSIYPFSWKYIEVAEYSCKAPKLLMIYCVHDHSTYTCNGHNKENLLTALRHYFGVERLNILVHAIFGKKCATCGKNMDRINRWVVGGEGHHRSNRFINTKNRNWRKLYCKSMHAYSCLASVGTALFQKYNVRCRLLKYYPGMINILQWIK